MISRDDNWNGFVDTIGKLPANPEFEKILKYLVKLEESYPGILKLELFEFLKVVENGAKKYALNNWLDPKGQSVGHKDMHDKMFHHLSRSFTNETRQDEESKEDHLLHLATRAMMLYTRIKLRLTDEPAKDELPFKPERYFPVDL
jgi:hypothetical protein